MGMTAVILRYQAYREWHIDQMSSQAWRTRRRTKQLERRWMVHYPQRFSCRGHSGMILFVALLRRRYDVFRECRRCISQTIKWAYSITEQWHVGSPAVTFTVSLARFKNLRSSNYSFCCARTRTFAMVTVKTTSDSEWNAIYHIFHFSSSHGINLSSTCHWDQCS